MESSWLLLIDDPPPCSPRGYRLVPTARIGLLLFSPTGFHRGLAAPECRRGSRSSRWSIQWWQSHTRALRSEEYTSELQSRGHLVCRLLLVKKKTCTWL